jgi:hypothetical protein
VSRLLFEPDACGVQVWAIAALPQIVHSHKQYNVQKLLYLNSYRRSGNADVAARFVTEVISWLYLAGPVYIVSKSLHVFNENARGRSFLEE